MAVGQRVNLHGEIERYDQYTGRALGDDEDRDDSGEHGEYRQNSEGETEFMTWDEIHGGYSDLDDTEAHAVLNDKG